MSSLTVKTVQAARATANDWLLSNLPDRFATGIPEYAQSLQGWRIPVWLSYPQIEPLGPVGELVIDEASGGIASHTAIDEMKARPLSLYEQHREQIEAPFL
jgi:hypothetical protein